uniref:F-box domain-containing protein n=1 Tax=Globodera rostochiensis TaxID=31243 RepID=A0A914GTG4_GLORO
MSPQTPTHQIKDILQREELIEWGRHLSARTFQWRTLCRHWCALVYRTKHLEQKGANTSIQSERTSV